MKTIRIIKTLTAVVLVVSLLLISGMTAYGTEISLDNSKDAN